MICRNFLSFFIVIILGFVSFNLIAQTRPNFLVLGVIASNIKQSGVALIKDLDTSKTFAVKESFKIKDNIILKQVNNKNIIIVVDSKEYSIKVGEDFISALSNDYNNKTKLYSNYQIDLHKEIEKPQEDVIKVSKSLKDVLVNNKLSEILMQAAAIPYEVNGRIQGFQLWEIEDNSIFKVAGFNNGDIITAINGTPLNDASMAIKILLSLKNANEATINYISSGKEKNLKIMIQ